MFAKKMNRILFYLALFLIVYMPLHIFLAQLFGKLFGYLDVWKAAKDILVIAFVPLMLLAAYRQKLFQNRTFRTFIYLGAAYALLYVLFLIFKHSNDPLTSITGAVYNTRILIFLLLGIVVGAADYKRTERLGRAALVISTLVAAFGVAQFFLPKDLLSHVGYSIETGVKPIFFINDDPALPRIMSTIRDPNSLGAFLLLPTLVIVDRLVRQKSNRTILAALGFIHMAALYLSFSRAAWGGFLVALLVLTVFYQRRRAMGVFKRYWPIFLIGAFLLAGGMYQGRNVPFIRHELLRINDKDQATDLDSDDLHAHFISKAAKGVAEKPLGHGPGTAGIVSIRSKQGSFLTENYYLQIAYEVGIIGLALFLALWAFTVKMVVKTHSAAGSIMLAASVAYAIMALVMHLWSNEAVALQWWLFAGIVASPNFIPRNKSHEKN